MKKLPTIEEIAEGLWRADEPPPDAQWGEQDADWKRIYRRMARYVLNLIKEHAK